MQGDSEVMAHRPRNKKRSWHFDHLTYVFGHGDGNCWNPFDLDGALNQSHGLVANGSSWSQQSNIGVLLFGNSAGNVGGHSALEPLRIHVIADEAEEILG